MFDSIVDLISGAWWVYWLIFAAAAFDVIFPVLPSETLVITGGIVAAQGSLFLGFIILAAGVGAFCGDNLAYWIGDRGEHLARRWILRGQKGKRTLKWADTQLDRHGGTIVIVGRFIPGGRTATTIGAGILSFPWRRFAAFDAAGAATWGTVNAVIGFVGGSAFKDQAWLAFVVSFGVAIAVAGLIELGRRITEHRRKSESAQATEGSTVKRSGRRPEAAPEPSRRR